MVEKVEKYNVKVFKNCLKSWLQYYQKLGRSGKNQWKVVKVGGVRNMGISKFWLKSLHLKNR